MRSRVFATLARKQIHPQPFSWPVRACPSALVEVCLSGKPSAPKVRASPGSHVEVIERALTATTEWSVLLVGA